MAVYYYARKLQKAPSSSSSSASTHRRSKTPPARMNVNGFLPGCPANHCNGPVGLPPPPPPCSTATLNGGFISGGNYRFMPPANMPTFHSHLPHCHYYHYFHHYPPQHSVASCQEFHQQHHHFLCCGGCHFPPPLQLTNISRIPKKTGEKGKSNLCDEDSFSLDSFVGGDELKSEERFEHFSSLPLPPCKVHSESGKVYWTIERKKGSERNHKDLVFSQGQLMSGSWDGFVKHLVPSEDYFPSEEYMFTFLLSARLYVKPHELLKRIFEEIIKASGGSTDKYDEGDKSVNSSLLDGNGTGPGPPVSQSPSILSSPSHNHSHNSPMREKSQRRRHLSSENRLIGSTFVTATGIAPTDILEESPEDMELPLNVIPLLVEFLRPWAKRFPYDFREDKMMAYIQVLANKCVDSNEEAREQVSEILAALLSRLASLEKYEEFLHRISTESSIGEPIAAPSVVTICPDPVTMAEQLTLVEIQRLSLIGAEEFIQTLGKEDLKTGTRTCDCINRKTKNLEAYVLWFRRLTFYVASEICKMSKKKSRGRVIEYWVQVAKECLAIRNFNSLMAILAGLNMFPVARLKKTWTKPLYTDLAEVAKAVDPRQNYAPYRKLYKAAVWQSSGGKGSRPQTPNSQMPTPTGSLSSHHRHFPSGSAENSKTYRILVPYFSLLIKDIHNLDSVHPSKLPNGHIDFEKCRQLAKIVREITSWQKVSCDFVQVQNVFNSVQASPIFNEQELVYASYICEQPENQREKEHFKKLHKKNVQVPLIACNNSSSENDT